MVVASCLLTGCGGTDNECAILGRCAPAGPTATSFPVPSEFGALMEAIHSESAELHQRNRVFIDSANTLLGDEPGTLARSQVESMVGAFYDSGDALVYQIGFMDALLEAYDTATVGATAQALHATPTWPGARPLGGSFDALFFKDMGKLMDDGFTAAEACKTKFPSESDDDYINYQLCVREVAAQVRKEGFAFGVSTYVGGGAGAVAGFALYAASLPVVVYVGGGIAVGVVVGKIWSWCTATKDSHAANVCVLQTCEGEVRDIGGQNAVYCAMPPGHGTMVITVPGKAPFTVELTVGAGGTTIDLSSCFADVATATPAQVQACIDAIQTNAGVATGASSCGEILGVTAGISPVDPIPGESVAVTYSVVPAIEGCPTSYTVEGTDGYSANGTPLTDAEGEATFTIPGAAAAVTDTVEIRETTNGNAYEIVYVF